MKSIYLLFTGVLLIFVIDSATAQKKMFTATQSSQNSIAEENPSNQAKYTPFGFYKEVEAALKLSLLHFSTIDSDTTQKKIFTAVQRSQNSIAEETSSNQAKYTPSNFYKDMEAALKLHEDAVEYSGEVEAVKAFVKLTEEYNNQWLPPYWASYLYTQLTNILVRDISVANEGTTLEGMISKSQEYLDIAKKRKGGDMTSSVEADFHNLQGLIYFFKARTAENEEEKNKYLNERTKSISSAINLDPDNPNTQVMAATELIRHGYNEKDLQKVLGGKLLLENAKITYENTSENRSTTTHWAKDFVNFWLGFAQKTIEEFDQTDINSPGSNN